MKNVFKMKFISRIKSQEDKETCFPINPSMNINGTNYGDRNKSP